MIAKLRNPLKKGFLLILHKQNCTHLHNPCNTPSQCKYFEMKAFFINLSLTNDSFPDTDWRSFEEIKPNLQGGVLKLP